MDKKNHTEAPEEAIQSALSRSEQFIEKNGKTLLTILIGVIVIVGGFFLYGRYSSGRNEKASAMMFNAEQLFAIDSFEMALNGDGNTAGFVDVIGEFSATEQANVARHYAGICCLNLGKYDEAIKYFQEFSDVSGASGDIISAQNYGLTGDAYVQKGSLEEGVKMYEKAAAHSDNEFTAPYYLKKAGLVYQGLNKYAEALKTYEKIKNEYPATMDARDIDKYIQLVKQK